MEMMRKHERGQVLVIVALAFIGLVAFIGLAVDAAHLFKTTGDARNSLNTACVHAANIAWRGGDGYAAFVNALQVNGMPQESWEPQEGTGDGLIRGFEYEWATMSIHTALAYEVETYFIQIIGITELPVRATERCTITGTFLTPIAVKRSAFDDSLANGTWIHVVGQGSDADIDSGKNYRGVIFPFLWCVKSETDHTPDTNCSYALPQWPLEESPPSAQTAKNLLKEYCWEGLCNRVFPPVGMRLAIVSGTSNNQLCKEAQDAGLVPGKEFVAIIYDGEVVTPDPSFGNWENIGVDGWGTFVVVDLDPNDKNCNSLVAVATGGIYSSPYEASNALFPREIPWDAQGGWY